MKDSETTVTVVGGGPCGMLTALLLARAGVPCVLCEQHAGISTHPKALGISRRTAEIFRQCGFLDEMMAGGPGAPDMSLMVWAKSLTGEELGRAPMPAKDPSYSPCHAFHAPQTHTEHVLLNALLAEPLADVRFEHRVRKLSSFERGVEADVACASGGYSLRSEWMVAADGAGSPVRKMLGIEADGPGDLGHFLNVFFHSDLHGLLAQPPALLYNILGPDFAEFFVSVNGRDLWLMHHFLMPDAPVPGEEDLVGLIRSAAGVADLRVRILGVAPWVMSPKVAQKFRSGRVFLAGDSAARLSPAGGMGMNTGLQSAHNLAWKLAAVVQGTARESILDSYEAERHALSLAIMRHTNGNSGEIFRQVNCAMQGDWEGLKELIARSHRFAEDRQFDCGVRYGEAYRFPHVPVGGGASSLDWFGREFVAVAGSRAVLGGRDLPRVEYLEHFPEETGCDDTGAVLVRPDGFVCWTKPCGVTNDDLRVALAAARA